MVPVKMFVLDILWDIYYVFKLTIINLHVDVSTVLYNLYPSYVITEYNFHELCNKSW
jgi:hypothetical protein